MTPDPLNQLVAQLARLPGVGEKTAQRLAFHILRAPPEYARDLSRAIEALVEKVRLCSRCFALSEAELCSFCADPRRDERTLCVVEGVADLLAIDGVIECPFAVPGAPQRLQGSMASQDFLRKSSAASLMHFDDLQILAIHDTA